MSRTVFVNGEYLPEENATISVFDRGFLFGDGVYEVIPIVRGKLVDEDYSIERLRHSLSAVEIAWPCTEADYLAMLRELIRRNGVTEGSVYVQITRGIAERDFAYPPHIKSTIMAYTSSRSLLDNPAALAGVKVVSVPDLRWQRRDIKSLNLLGQCMAKQQAAAQGAFEAWMLEDGMVTEGASSSAFIIKDKTIITRALSNAILPGIRRRVILELAELASVTLVERSFSLEEALAADEAFISSATTLVMPVVSIDGKVIADGKPGPLTQKLRSLYIESLLAEAASK
ncbi:D-amino-acid transaminase [Pseudohongiella sp.]|uniref:D-amino acid aminotransferase n=1 Tax=marine sediment metagenome TaxID=412755 RepID=A0A0F9V1M1_9ZZZZ|nr:D-amino-acid transaminase [Pseudohongiella sp.]HDZ08876.1 D-amino-acid transaminase [Pseudohongiella sp.]HEA64046.1 D-amino-acid transaminase [Pseudohongiella sp.]